MMAVTEWCEMRHGEGMDVRILMSATVHRSRKEDHPTMGMLIKRVLWLILGWSFMALGVAGLFLPVLQGILFLLIGLAILSTEYHWARRWITRLCRKYPAADRKMHQLLGKYARFIPHTDSTTSGD